jgi:hypothetical protein
MFDPVLEVINGFSAMLGSIVPPGRGYFPHHLRHFVPGYYRVVPPGQKTLDRRGFTEVSVYGLKPWAIPS